MNEIAYKASRAFDEGRKEVRLYSTRKISIPEGLKSENLTYCTVIYIPTKRWYHKIFKPKWYKG